MSEICPKCGLFKELCVCETIAREDQRITITTIKRKFGKLTTMVTGIDPKSIDIKDVAKKLKSKLACGGTYKDNHIELLGDHRFRMKDVLKSLGYKDDQVEIS